MFDTQFFRVGHSDEAKFESKSGSNNKNVKNVMFGFKIGTKNSYPYLVFLRVEQIRIFKLDKFSPELMKIKC